jgi:glucokinase
VADRWLGLDLGGSTIKAAIVEGGALIERHTVPADTAGGPDVVLGNLASVGAAAMAGWGPITAVGLGLPGLFDTDTGTVEMFPNLPGRWAGMPVVERLSAALGRTVAIINDARAFTLAEARLGAAVGCSTVAAYVLGTGIGGGLVIGGRLHFGRHGRAGELAHQIVVTGGPRCGCGNRGCLEAVATSGVLAREAGQPSPAAAFAAAAAGDERAERAVAEVIEHLGRAIANTVTAILPERVVIGGGVAQAGDALFGPLRAAVARHVTLVPPDWYDIVPAVLGRHAGAVGAALWAAESAAPAITVDRWERT